MADLEWEIFVWPSYRVDGSAPMEEDPYHWMEQHQWYGYAASITGWHHHNIMDFFWPCDQPDTKSG